MSQAAELVALVAFLGLMAAAALWDLRCRRIPNAIPAALAVLFPLPVLLAGSIAGLGVGLAGGLLGLMLGLVGYRLRLWGGGDAKLVAAAALWTGLAGLPRFLVVMSLAGGVLALAVLAARRFGHRAGSLPLPYGVAIAVAGLDLFFQRILFVCGH